MELRAKVKIAVLHRTQFASFLWIIQFNVSAYLLDHRQHAKGGSYGLERTSKNRSTNGSLSMKPSVKRLAIGLCTVFVFASQSAVTFAQSSAPPQESRAAARKANHMLEHNVLIALGKAKLDPVDVRVIAKHGDVALVGEISTAADIDKAATIAGQVPGVNSVKNYLTVYEEGTH